MKKKVVGRKLSRKRDQRRALKKGLVGALFLNEKIKTTQAKAKEISRSAEKCITKAKKSDISARRQLAVLFGPLIVKKLVDDIGKRYKDRVGGYTRIIKLGPRKSDGAEMAIIELVE